MTAIDPKVLMAWQNYALPTQQAIQRSQYLADALKSIQDGGKNIQSVPELAVRGLAQYITQRKQGNADRDLIAALKGEQQRKIDSALGSLEELGGAAQPSLSPQPAPAAASPAMPQPPATPAAATQPSRNDALFNALIGQESNGRPGVTGPPTPYGRAQGMTQMLPATGQGMAQKLGVPWQPEMMTQTTPEAADYQKKLGRAYFDEGLQKYGGDERQALMYYHGGPNQKIWGPKTNAYADQVLARAGPTQQTQLPPAMPQPQGGVQPYQVASNGSTPPPPMMQPQGAPPPTALAPPAGVGGAPPAAVSPVAGGQPSRVTQQEIGFARQLLTNPDTFEQGQAYLFELQKKNAAPVKYDTGNINGVPTWTDPYNPGVVQTGGVPQAAMSRNVNAQDLGINAPTGTVMGVDPTGKTSSVYAPPAGYQAGPGGAQSAVQGGPADPRSGQNLYQGEAELRKEYDSKLTNYRAARDGYQKVISAARDNTGASDIALIFGFMKTLDPGSTVREGEFATAQNSGSISQSVMNAYNKAIKGERLQPEQRQAFAQTAANQFGVQQQQADALNKRFGDIAQSYGYDPRRVVQNFDPLAAPKPLAKPKAPPPASPQAAAQSRLDTLMTEKKRRAGGK